MGENVHVSSCDGLLRGVCGFDGAHPECVAAQGEFLVLGAGADGDAACGEG